MKKLSILLTVAIAACTSQEKTEHKGNNPNEQEDTAAAVPLNNGSKWKADEATKENVAKIVLLVNDNTYADATKRSQLYAHLQTKIDTLVKQCNMQGAEHDALHVWLEKVLKDMKDLKEEDDEHTNAYATLKKDIENFYAIFE